MLKAFHLAPSLKIITHTQATLNLKERNFIRQNQVQPNSGLWLPDYMGYLAESYQSVPLFTKRVRGDIWSWVYIENFNPSAIFSAFQIHQNTPYLFHITPIFDRCQEAPVKYEEN